MEYKRRSRFCLLLAALCLFTALPSVEGRAGEAVDTGRKCSLSVSLGFEPTAQDLEDLEKSGVAVDICRVAGVDATGAYREAAGFEELYKALEDLEEDPGKADAAFWKEQAEAAAETYRTLAADGEGAGKLLTYTIRLEGGESLKGDLPVGLYLVCPKKVVTDMYRYTFEPYLIQLPGNHYGTGEGDGKDAWIYDAATVLKAEKVLRSGDVLIEKTLEKHNASLGPAVFVFRIDALKDLDEDGVKENVYSDVVTISFDEAGTKSVLVEGLPAGAEVTVTEVYAGSAYGPDGGKDTLKVIVRGTDVEEDDPVDSVAAAAEEDGDTEENGADEENGPVKTAFTNRYNNILTPGSGVTNRFTAEGETSGEDGMTAWTWRWEKILHGRLKDTE